MTYYDICSCRRIFTTPEAMKNHQNVCTISKKHLSSALLLAVQKAKRLEALAIRKKAQEYPDVDSVRSPGQKSNTSSEAVSCYRSDHE
jgi:hypothetical protein